MAATGVNVPIKVSPDPSIPSTIDRVGELEAAAKNTPRNILAEDFIVLVVPTVTDNLYGAVA